MGIRDVDEVASALDAEAKHIKIALLEGSRAIHENVACGNESGKPLKVAKIRRAIGEPLPSSIQSSSQASRLPDIAPEDAEAGFRVHEEILRKPSSEVAVPPEEKDGPGTGLTDHR